MAKVKTATATTKRTAPMKACPGCGKSIHAAKQTCACGHKFAVKERAERAKWPTKGGLAGLTGDTQSILSALDFVQKVGSIEAAQAALDALTKIKDTLAKTETTTTTATAEEIETP